MMADHQEMLNNFLRLSPVVPVITIDNSENAPQLARALLAGGIRIMEITIRTEAAYDAIKKIHDQVSDMIVGAGTISSSDQAETAVASGAQFIVSPGSSTDLLEKSRFFGVPLLPGAATPSEIMNLIELGYSYIKMFPAEAMGGTRFLQSIAGPFANIKFCPTGGITADKASAYLKLENVISVGGSWLAPRHALAAGNWQYITDQARQAINLKNR